MRILKGLAWSVCFVVMVLVMAFTWGRIRGPSESQAEALKFFARDMKPTTGRNVFPATWLGNYDIPADHIDSVYEQDRERVLAWQASLPVDGAPLPEFVSAADGKYSKLTALSHEEADLTCSWRNKDCVGNVRNHRDRVAALLATHAIQLDHDKSYITGDFSWNDLPVGFIGPFPPPGRIYAFALTSAALDFVDGKTTSALQQACANVVGIRRLHTHGNTFNEMMINASLMTNAASVFAQMLSELPIDRQLPVNCSQAFAAVGAEDVDLGASMQNDFQTALIYRGPTRTSPKKKRLTDFISQLSFSQLGFERQRIAQNAWLCSDEAHKLLLGDRQFGIKDFPAQADLFDWLSNASGSILIFIAQPGYPDYLNRQEDAAATLRLVATILWLRQTHANGMPLAERLLQRPAWMHMAEDRHFGLSKDGRHLLMDYHHRQRSGADVTEWPLPAGL